MTPIVLDAGALIALERREPRMLALADGIVKGRLPAYTPAGVVAQVWRGAARQQPIARLLRSRAVVVDHLTGENALQIGVLLAASGTADVVDAHVVLLGRRVRGTVITSDPRDIEAIDPDLAVRAV